MAEEVPKTAHEQAEMVVVTHDVTTETTPPAPPPPTVEVVEKEPSPVPETEVEEAAEKKEDVEVEETEESKASGGGEEEKINITQSASFKEESTKISDLPDSEKKALEEFKLLIQEALNKHEFSALTAPPPPPTTKEEEKKEEAAAVVAEEEEEKKPEEAPPASAAVVAEEEKKPEEAPAAAAAAVVAEEEEKKPEEATPAAAADEISKPAESKEGAAVVEKVDETVVIEETTVPAAVVTVDEDGAKRVEAIEETIVAVSSSVTQEETCAAEEETETKVDAPPPPPEEKEEEKPAEAAPPPPPEEVSIWGIPLLADERSDVILLKFLRARDFKVKEAFTMLKNTIKWRKEFKIDELLDEDLGDDLGIVVFMHGFDKEGHPVCYNVYGEFQNKELYQKTFSDEEKRQRFLRWRIQFLERSIRKLDFSPGGISTIVQVNDLKNSPGPVKWELRQATKQALHLLQDNYPEFVARQIFINVPWWYLVVNRMISPFLTQRTKSKFVFAGPSKSPETLLRYISAEQLPVKYGGLSKEGEFGTDDVVTEITVKAAAKHTVEFPVSETCLLTWEIRVVGWEVSYGAEFVPSAEDSYTVIVQKSRKVGANEEPVVCNSFKIGEPGKVVLTIDNHSSKKKKLLYRLKTRPASD